MSTAHLTVQMEQPSRALIFFLALLGEAILLSILAAWLRPMQPHRTEAKPPIAVQLVPWPQHRPAQQVAPIPTPPSFPSKKLQPQMYPRPARAMSPHSLPSKGPQSEPSTPREIHQQRPSPPPMKTQIPAAPLPSSNSALTIPSARAEHYPARSLNADHAPAAIPIPAAPTDPVESAAEVRPRIPAYADNPSPQYPDSARWAGEQGTVLLRVLVGSDGHVQDILVAKSSGFDALDRAAEKAVRQWRFTPGSRDGQSTAMWVEIPIRFRLQDAEE